LASVFVSYAREDANKAKAIARALENASLDVWFDERIHSGSEFSTEIEQALAAASAVVVLWSKDSVTSPWVRDEAAEGRDSQRLVPVLLDDSRPPMGFRQFQATDLSRWSGRGRPKQLDEVIAAIGAKAGVDRPVPVKPKRAPGRRPASPMLWTLAALVAVLVGVGGWLATRQFAEPPPATVSVAILPFKADSSDPVARRHATDVRDAVAHTLAQGAFSVTTIDTLAPDVPPTDFVISGNISSAADKIIARLQMQETAHHVVVFSHQFESARDKIGDFPEMVGAQVASQLSWTAPLIALERRHPSDPAVVNALLQSSAAGMDSVGTLHDYETARRLAAKAPNSALAQNGLAYNAAFALSELPREQRAEAVAAGRQAADRAIALAPEFGDNYVPWCLLRSEIRRLQCEARLRGAMRTDPDSPFANWFLANLVLNPVGRNKEAADLAALSLAHDQYMPYKIGLAIRTLEVLGRTDESDELSRKASRWWPGNGPIMFNRWAGAIQRGDFKAAQRIESETGEQSAVLLAINRKSLPALRSACPPKTSAFDGILCMLGLARLGDLDGAYAVADRLYPSRRARTAAEEERLWLDNPGTLSLAYVTSPGAAPLRRDPRYLALAERTGLLEYWRSGRLPDFCGPPKPEPVCSAIARRG